MGRLVDSKGLFELIEAMQLVRAAGVAASLSLVGSGPDEAALRERVALWLAGHSDFPGTKIWCGEKDAAWRNADLFAFPTYHEGLPYIARKHGGAYAGAALPRGRDSRCIRAT